MNFRRPVTPFALGLFKHKGTVERTSGSWCKFEPYAFPETSENGGEKATKVYRRFGPRSDTFIKFSTANVCPAVVIVSTENWTGGSGIIIDSNGTVLTQARNIFSRDFRSNVNVCLHDRRKFSGTILEVNEDYDLALLKIQSEFPLPIARFGSLENYKARELISVHRLLTDKDFPRTSSQNEVHEEGNLILSDKEFIFMKFGNFTMGLGGPIATLDGEVVGICTEIDTYFYPLNSCGTRAIIETIGIEEALSKVGYTEKMIHGIVNR